MNTRWKITYSKAFEEELMGYSRRVDEYIDRLDQIGIGTQRAYDRYTKQYGHVNSSGWFVADEPKETSSVNTNNDPSLRKVANNSYDKVYSQAEGTFLAGAGSSLFAAIILGFILFGLFLIGAIVAGISNIVFMTIAGIPFVIYMIISTTINFGSSWISITLSFIVILDVVLFIVFLKKTRQGSRKMYPLRLALIIGIPTFVAIFISCLKYKDSFLYAYYMIALPVVILMIVRKYVQKKAMQGGTK